MAQKKTVSKKKKDIKLSSWILHVRTTSNNTHITLSDTNWNKVLGGWTWTQWFKGAKKSTPFAAETLARKIFEDAKSIWLETITLVFAWVGMAREGVFKAINELAWSVELISIQEKTWIQFGWVKWTRPKRN